MYMFICVCPYCPVCTYMLQNCLKNFPEPSRRNVYPDSIIPGMRGKHHDRDKMDVGVSDVIKLIECYNPEVSKAILRCGMPFLTARKLVRRLINLTVTENYSQNYKYSPFIDYLC